MAFNFIDYMTNIAKTMKAISHLENNKTQKRFYRVSGLNGIEELLNNLTDPKMYPAILANDLEFGKVGDVSTSNNFLDRQSHIFYIVGYCDLNDFNATLSLTEYDLVNGGFTPLSDYNKPQKFDVGYFWDDEGDHDLIYSQLIEIKDDKYTNSAFNKWTHFSKEVPEWFTKRINPKF